MFADDQFSLGLGVIYDEVHRGFESGSVTPLDSLGFSGISGSSFVGSSDLPDSPAYGSHGNFTWPKGSKAVVLAHAELSQGDEYESDEGIRHPARYYKPRVVEWGSFTRQLSGPPPTMPVISAGGVKFADTSSYWRTLLAGTTQRRRPVTFKVGPEGGQEQYFPVAFTGEFEKAKYSPGLFHAGVTDIWKRWLSRQIPHWIDPINFPYAEVTSGFFPLIFGRVESDGGAIPLILVDSLTNDYAINRTLTKEIIAIYRQLSGSEVWSLVPSSEYTMVEAAKVIDGYTYTITTARFGSAQAAGTKLRANVDGTRYRGPFGVLPEIHGTIENPVDHIINMLYYLSVLEPTALDFDDWSFLTNWQKYHDRLLKFAGVFYQQISFGEAISQICHDAQLYIYPDRYGLVACEFMIDTPEDREVFDENYGGILRAGGIVQGGSGGDDDLAIEIFEPERTVNQFDCSYRRNYTTGKYEKKYEYNNEDDQEELGGDDGEPFLEPDKFEFPFIRDTDTLVFMIAELASWLALHCYKVNFWLNAPYNVPRIDLAQCIGITYYAGMGGAWTDQPARVFAEMYDVTRQLLMITAVVRMNRTEQVDLFTGCIPIGLLEGEIEPDDIDTRWDGTQQLLPPADLDGIVGSQFEASFERDFDVDDHSFQVVDGAGTVYGTLTFPPAPGSEFGYRSTMRTDITLALAQQTYYLKTLASDTPGCHFNQARIWACVENSNRIGFQIPMLFGAQDIGGHSGSEQANNRNFSAAEVWASTTYQQEATFLKNYGIFKKERSKWGDIDLWRITANAYNKSFNPGEYGRAALFNLTAGLMVAGTEMEWTSDNDDPVRKAVQVEDDAANFTDGDEFGIYTLSSSGVFARRLMLNRVDLWPVLDGNTRPCQVYMLLASNASGGEPGNYRTKLEAYPDDTVYQFEVVASRVSGTAWVQLLDAGTSDDGDTGTLVHQFNYTGTAKSRQRAVVTGLTVGNRYIINVQNVRLTAAFLIAEVPGDA